MKVLHCITGLNTGGAETMLCKLVSRLPGLGVECRVVSLLPEGPLAALLRSQGVKVDSLEMRRGVPSVSSVIRLVSILREWQPDLLQTWLYHADLLGLIAAKLAGSIPVVWSIRCSYMDLTQYSRTTSLVLKACSWLSSLPHAVLANSEEARRFHRELGYTPRQFEVIPNGFDTEVFRPSTHARSSLRSELGISEETPLIGLVARFDPMKDHATFFMAARHVLRSHPSARFVLCGDNVSWGNNAITALVYKNGLADAVFLLGRRDDVPMVTAGLDVAVCCSRGESFPNVVGEAMACGVPCVVTDVGDSARVVNEAGLVVPPEDGEALGEALNSLLMQDVIERGHLGEKGRQRVLARYSLEAVAARYLDLYSGIRRQAD